MIDGMSSDWMDLNLDMGGKFKISDNIDVLTGVNLFNYTNPLDNNNDGFTDITIQERVSFFQKWSLQRDAGRLFTLAGRFLYEDRWVVKWIGTIISGEERRFMEKAFTPNAGS